MSGFGENMIRLCSTEKKALILRSALDCFLQYGFSKTSLDDISKKANISRTVIYLYYKNKTDILLSGISEFFSQSVLRAKNLLKGKLSKKEKLMAILETCYFEHWPKIVESPHGEDLFHECFKLYPQIELTQKKEFLSLLKDILPHESKADIFWYSFKGLQVDRPSISVLRKRAKILVEIFLN